MKMKKVTKIFKFYDTSSLLKKANSLEDEKFIISSVTLKELEEIKTSTNKDFLIKAKARKVIKYLKNNIDSDRYKVWIYDRSMLNPIIEKSLPLNHDTEILATAIDFDMAHPDETMFVTNDLSLYNIANLFFGSDSIEMV